MASDTSYTAANPSPRWHELVALYREMHTQGDGVRPPEKMFAGPPRPNQIPRLKMLIEETGARTLLDYGSGKGEQWKLSYNLDAIADTTERRLMAYLGLDSVRCYDPGVAAFSTPPENRFDGVICFDVLEHCPEDDIPWILDQIFGYARKFVLANVACFPAGKSLPNGENAHCTVMPVPWWRERVDAVAARYPDLRYRIICEQPAPRGQVKPTVDLMR